MPKKSAHKNKLEKKNYKLKNRILYLCSCCAVIILLYISAQNIKTADSSRRVLGIQTKNIPETQANINEEITFWHDFLEQTPTYFNGWLELASLEFQAGNVDAAKMSLARAKEIDPNSENLKIIETSPDFD